MACRSRGSGARSRTFLWLRKSVPCARGNKGVYVLQAGARLQRGNTGVTTIEGNVPNVARKWQRGV